MLASDLYKLACSEHACAGGLNWLLGWMNTHPKGTASQFFLDQLKNIPVRHRQQLVSLNMPREIRHQHAYACWCWRNLLDWTEVDRKDRTYSDRFYRTSRTAFTLRVLGSTADSAIPKALFEALARAFED